jgi:hypothetical protein
MSQLNEGWSACTWFTASGWTDYIWCECVRWETTAYVTRFTLIFLSSALKMKAKFLQNVVTTLCHTVSTPQNNASFRFSKRRERRCYLSGMLQYVDWQTAAFVSKELPASLFRAVQEKKSLQWGHFTTHGSYFSAKLRGHTSHIWNHPLANYSGRSKIVPWTSSGWLTPPLPTPCVVASFPMHSFPFGCTLYVDRIVLFPYGNTAFISSDLEGTIFLPATIVIIISHKIHAENPPESYCTVSTNV